MSRLTRFVLALLTVGLLVGGLVGPADATGLHPYRKHSIFAGIEPSMRLVTHLSTDLTNADPWSDLSISLQTSQGVPSVSVLVGDTETALFTGTFQQKPFVVNGFAIWEVGVVQDEYGPRIWVGLNDGSQVPSAMQCEGPTAPHAGNGCLGPVDKTLEGRILNLKVSDVPNPNGGGSEWTFWYGIQGNPGLVQIAAFPTPYTWVVGEGTVCEINSAQSPVPDYPLNCGWSYPKANGNPWPYFDAQLLPSGIAPNTFIASSTDGVVYCDITDAHYYLGRLSVLSTPYIWSDSDRALGDASGLTPYCTEDMVLATKP